MRETRMVSLIRRVGFADAAALCTPGMGNH